MRTRRAFYRRWDLHVGRRCRRLAVWLRARVLPSERCALTIRSPLPAPVDVAAPDPMDLDAALDRFWAAADLARGLAIDTVQVVTDEGPHGERRRIADIRRDVYSVSKTVTSLAIGQLESDGALTLDDPVLMHLPDPARHRRRRQRKDHHRPPAPHLTASSACRWCRRRRRSPRRPGRDFLAAPTRGRARLDLPLTSRRQHLCPRPSRPRDLGKGPARLPGPPPLRPPRHPKSPVEPVPPRLPARSDRPPASDVGNHPHRPVAPARRHPQRLTGAWIPAAYIARMTADTTDTGRAELGQPGPTACTRGDPAPADSAWRMDGIYGQFRIHRSPPTARPSASPRTTSWTNTPDPRLRVGAHRARLGTKDQIQSREGIGGRSPRPHGALINP